MNSLWKRFEKAKIYYRSVVALPMYGKAVDQNKRCHKIDKRLLKLKEQVDALDRRRETEAQVDKEARRLQRFKKAYPHF
jgi:hypothetical protein